MIMNKSESMMMILLISLISTVGIILTSTSHVQDIIFTLMIINDFLIAAEIISKD